MRAWQMVLTGVLGLWCVSSAMAETIAGQVQMKGADDHRHVVVYIDGLEQRGPLTAQAEIVVDQHRLEFVPHVLPIVVGSPVTFANSDVMLHDIFLLDVDGTRHPFRSFGADHTLSHTFDKPGFATLLCRRHHEMWASILVLRNPYYAVTDREGQFTINDVPPGSYTVTAWHERRAPVSRQITVEAGGEARVDFTLGALLASRHE